MDEVNLSDNINRCIDAIVEERDFGTTREQVIITLIHDALLYDDKVRCVIKNLLLKGYSDIAILNILPGGGPKKGNMLKQQHKLLDEIIKKEKEESTE